MAFDWGTWFDNNIRNDFRFEGSAFWNVMRDSDSRFGTRYGAEVLLAKFDDTVGFRGQHLLCDMDELQIMYENLTDTMQRAYCWYFIRHLPERARDIFITIENQIDSEREAEA